MVFICEKKLLINSDRRVEEGFLDTKNGYGIMRITASGSR